jgi:hypothetical protein
LEVRLKTRRPAVSRAAFWGSPDSSSDLRGALILLFGILAMPSSVDAQAEEHFWRFTFEGVAGTVPKGWIRSGYGRGGLRMTPGDATGFLLDVAMTKVAPRWEGDVPPAPIVFLRDLNLFKQERWTLRELPGDRAVAVSDYGAIEGRGYVRHRAYYVALRAEADTMYIVVATASEPVPTRSAPFTKAHIRIADDAILGIIVDSAPVQREK